MVVLAAMRPVSPGGLTVHEGGRASLLRALRQAMDVAMRLAPGYEPGREGRMAAWRVRARPPKGNDGRYWQLVIRSPEGKIRQKSARTLDPEAARRMAAAEEERLNGGIAAGLTVRGALEARMAALRREGSPQNTLKNYRSARAAADLFGTSAPSRESVLRAQDELAARLSTATARAYMASCAAAWKWALERGMVSEEWPRVPRLRAQPTRKRAPTAEESAKILAGLSAYGPRGHAGWIVPLVALLYDTGARASEVCALRSGDVDRERCMVTFRETKTREVRTVPLSPEVVELLPVRSSPDDPLWITPTTGRPPSRNTVHHALAVVRARTGVSADVDVHSLRRGWITDFLRAGGSIADGMRITGHRTPQVYLAYARAALSAAEAELAKLRAYRGALPIALDGGLKPLGAER